MYNPKEKKLFKCPNCGALWKCPCESCVRFRRALDEVKTWDYEGDGIKCLTCGFSAHADYWLEWEVLDEGDLKAKHEQEVLVQNFRQGSKSPLNVQSA